MAAHLRTAVIGIGNEMHGDDGAGIAVVRRLKRFVRNTSILLLEAGTAPENFTGALRQFQPDLVILVDAADMHCPPGETAWINWEEIDGVGISTHSQSLSVLAEYLVKELGCKVAILGIQAQELDTVSKLSPPVKRIIDKTARNILSILCCTQLHVASNIKKP